MGKMRWCTCTNEITMHNYLNLDFPIIIATSFLKIKSSLRWFLLYFYSILFPLILWSMKTTRSRLWTFVVANNVAVKTERNRFFRHKSLSYHQEGIGLCLHLFDHSTLLTIDDLLIVLVLVLETIAMSLLLPPAASSKLLCVVVVPIS